MTLKQFSIKDKELQSLFRQLLSLNLFSPHEIPIQFNQLRARCHGLIAISTRQRDIIRVCKWLLVTKFMLICILIDMFREDALDISCSIELLSQEKLTARHRAENESFQSTLFCLWDDYQTRKIDGKLLLEQCVEAKLTAKCFKFNEALLGRILV